MNQSSTHLLARSEDLVITSSGEELLVFDLRSNQLHHLNPVTAAAWQAMDGTSAMTGILESVRQATNVDVSAESIQLAVVMLSEAGLLVGAVDAPSLLGNQSRRRFLKRAGLAGVAVPVIASMTAPSAALASSATCNNTTTCVANNICIGRAHGSNIPNEYGDYSPNNPIQSGSTGDYCCDSPSTGYCPPCLFERSDYGTNSAAWPNGLRYFWNYTCQ